MGEKRNFVGLMSIKKERLTPFFDSKNNNDNTEVAGLINSLLSGQIAPVVTCSIDTRDGVFVLDGAQRVKYMQEGSFVKCYHLGVLTESEAVENWFSLHNRLKDNILKILDIVNSLTTEQKMNISTRSAYSSVDLEDIKKIANFDFFAYIEKHQRDEPVQGSLFD